MSAIPAHDGELAVDQLNYLNRLFEGRSTKAILLWAWTTFGGQMVASSSFQTQSVPLLHMIAEVAPEMPVVFVDTGFHFAETLAFRDKLQAEYKLNVVVARSRVEKSEQFAQYGEGLYRQDPDLCCHMNKVEPMQRALNGKLAWISGVRRDQTTHRQALRILEPQANGILKIHPMLTWSDRKLWSYINRHNLPLHPLFEQGYMSIGCEPCTRPVTPGDDPRAGRWAGSDKTECGLHIDPPDPEGS